MSLPSWLAGEQSESRIMLMLFKAVSPKHSRVINTSYWCLIKGCSRFPDESIMTEEKEHGATRIPTCSCVASGGSFLSGLILNIYEMGLT